MSYYHCAYIYNKAYGDFEDKPITIEELIRLKRSRNPRYELVHKNLYSHKIYESNYHLKFCMPKEKKSYLCRVNGTQFEKLGFSSVCETQEHNIFKLGLSLAEKISLMINNKKYIIKKVSSCTEKIRKLMDNLYETDCEYIIEEDNEELSKKLSGNIICFEIHYTSPVKNEKAIAYMLNNLPIYEIDIKEIYNKYFKAIKNLSFEESVAYIKKYYENTDLHYIKGTLFEPVNFELDWINNKANVVCDDNKVLKIIVFKRDGEYRIRYEMDQYEQYDNTFFGKKMECIDTAKKFAQYRVYEHLNNRKNIFN